MSMNPSRRVVESLRLSDLAVDNRIITVRCILCRTADHYLAKDLLAIRGDVLYSTVGGACRRCGKREWIRVSHRLPTSADVGHLRIKRPAGVRTIQLWREGWFG
jgi:hypothetical protein